MILSLLEQKSAESVQTFVIIRVCIVLVCWLFMIVGVLVDLWSGVSTANALGEQLHSKGFRRTIEKTGDYIRVMIFTIMFDAMAICFVHHYSIPYATILSTVAILFIEGKSVIENSRRKKAHAAKIPEVVRKIIKAVTAEQATKLLEQINKNATTLNESPD